VKLGRNAMAIYQDLVELFGFNHRYNSVKRFVRGLKRQDPQQYDRLEFLMGEEAQVDYGLGAPTLHSSGKYRRPRLFIMTLKYSGRAFVKLYGDRARKRGPSCMRKHSAILRGAPNMSPWTISRKA